MKNIIEIRDLTKSFGNIHAVRGLSFSVKEGELFAFLGLNGAGKSTTINIICGELERDGGTVMIDGVSIDDDITYVKSKIGVVFQSSVLDGALTVYDNLVSRAALYGIFGEELKSRLDELDSLLEIGELLGRTVGKLSGGQRRRVDIARALLNKPRILILDEPTTGLDPKTRSMLWDVITRLRHTEGMTVFLTTHYMEEAADADFVVIIDSGVKSAEGTPLELKNQYTGDYITLYGIAEEAVMRLGHSYEPLRDAYRVFVPNTAAATELIVAHPELFSDYEITKGRMDDVFLAVTGKKLSGGEEK